MKNLYHSWQDIPFGIPQEPVLGPIQINVFLSDLLLIIGDIDFASHTNNITIYQTGRTIDEIVLSLQDSPKEVFQRFFDYKMKGNVDTYDFRLRKISKIQLETGDSSVKNSISKRLLGVNLITVSVFEFSKLSALTGATLCISTGKLKPLWDVLMRFQ